MIACTGGEKSPAPEGFFPGQIIPGLAAGSLSLTGNNKGRTERLETAHSHPLTFILHMKAAKTHPCRVFRFVMKGGCRCYGTQAQQVFHRCDIGTNRCFTKAIKA